MFYVQYRRRGILKCQAETRYLLGDICCMYTPSELKVPIWITNTECELGTLEFSKEGVSAILDSGRVVLGQRSSTVTYSVGEEIVPKSVDLCQKIPLQTELSVRLTPHIIVERPYTFEPGPIFEDIFPPSTLGFYNRMTLGKQNVIFTVQEIQNDSRLWLTVSDPYQNVVFEAHRIQPYEVEAIQMFDDDYIDERLYQKIGGGESAQSIINRFLDCPPPSWGELSKLVSDVSIPNLRIEATMKETLSQLVPTSFPERVRDELMAFLAFVIDDKIPDDDPVEYSVQLFPVAMTGSLSIRGTVLPIGGATAKVEAAVKAGIKKVLVPKANLNDVLIEDDYKDKIEVIPVETLPEVIEHALSGKGKEQLLKKLKSMKPPPVSAKIELESEKKMTVSKLK